MTEPLTQNPNTETTNRYETYKAALKAVTKKTGTGESLTIDDLQAVCPHLDEDRLREVLDGLDAHQMAYLALPPLTHRGRFLAAVWWVNPLGGFGKYGQANRLVVGRDELSEQPICGHIHLRAVEATDYAMNNWPERLR